MGNILATTRGIFTIAKNIRQKTEIFTQNLTLVVATLEVHSIQHQFQSLKLTIETIPGVKYFGGGPVERVPFFWYNLCFTVSYIPGVGAIRYDT